MDLNFQLYPECNAENSCTLYNLNIHQELMFTVDRTIHDYKCIIFTDSFVYEIPNNMFLSLKSSITHLYAKDVGLAELRRISFPFGQKLESVCLSGNRIRELKETVFYDAPNLINLDLSNNQIIEFSSNAFEKLSSLEILDLSMNQIVNVPFDLFQPLNNLVFLNLRHNRLQIKFGIFPEYVKTLDLSYNNIDIHQKFKIFSLLVNLETLLLHGNRIENIHFSVLSSANLKYIGLSDNLFPCSTLADIVLEMRSHNVILVFENKVKNTSNIYGIKCIE